ncbi:MAG: hypothetical protein AAFO94_19590, partial [Bacteroidota bacterium]
ENLPEGDYLPQISDANGCTFDGDIITVGQRDKSEQYDYEPIIFEPECPSNSISSDTTALIRFGYNFNEGWQATVDGGASFVNFTVMGAPFGTYNSFVVEPNGCPSDTFLVNIERIPDLTISLDSFEKAEVLTQNASFYFSEDQVPYESLPRAFVRVGGGTGSNYRFDFDYEVFVKPGEPDAFFGNGSFREPNNLLTNYARNNWGNGDTTLYGLIPDQYNLGVHESPTQLVIQARDANDCRSPWITIDNSDQFISTDWALNYTGWGGRYKPGDSISVHLNDYLTYINPLSTYCEIIVDTTQLIDTFLKVPALEVIEYTQWVDSLCEGESATLIIPEPIINISVSGYPHNFEYSADSGRTWQSSNVFTLDAGAYFPMVRETTSGITRRYSVLDASGYTTEFKKANEDCYFGEGYSEALDYEIDTTG